MDALVNDTLAPVDHNNPPDPITLKTGDDLSEYLNLTYAEILDRARALLAKAPSFYTIRDDAADADATEYMVKLRACWKAAEAARTNEKTPYDDAAGLVHAFFKLGILDPLGLAPLDKKPFDPMERTDLGAGPRINMAQTIFKERKEREERDRREAEAARLRRIEEDARRAREAEAARLRQIEDDARAARLAEERRIRDAEERRQRELAAEQARLAEDRRQAELSASRKRTDENRKQAEAEAAEHRRQEELARVAREAEEARLAADRRQREEAARLEEERVAEERRQREESAREEENRLAEQRAAAESAAAVSAADLTRARGGKGGVSSLKEFHDVRDIQRDRLDLEVLRPYFTDKALDQAIRGYMDANKATVDRACKGGEQPIRGCVLYILRKSAGRA